MYDLIISRAESILQGMRTAKIAYAQHSVGRSRDLEPFIAIEWNGDKCFTPSLVPTCQHDHPPAWMIEHLLGRFNLFFSISKEDVTRDAVTVMVETYMRVTKEPPPSPYPQGAMAKEFASDPSTDIMEALMVLRAENDTLGGCTIVSVCQPYVYEDGGGVKFLECRTHTEEDGKMGGAMAIAIRSFFDGTLALPEGDGH